MLFCAPFGNCFGKEIYEVFFLISRSKALIVCIVAVFVQVV